MSQGYYAAQLGPHGEIVPFEPSSLKPGIECPIQVQGQFHMNSKLQVSSDELLVLHFLLQSVEGIGSPARLLFNYMQAFIHPCGVVYEEVVFNMECPEQAVNHGRAMVELIDHLSCHNAQCVVIFITNHSHDCTGDLFISPGLCVTVTEVSDSSQLQQTT